MPPAPCAPSPPLARAARSRWVSPASPPAAPSTRPSTPSRRWTAPPRSPSSKTSSVAPAPRTPASCRSWPASAVEYDVVMVARADGSDGRRRAPPDPPVPHCHRRTKTVSAPRSRLRWRRRPLRPRTTSARPSPETYVDQAVHAALVNLEAAPRAGWLDDRGPGQRLARHPAPRSRRPRPGRRLQPQGLQRLLPAASASAWRPRASP